MVTFEVATEIDGSVATNFRPGNTIHLQLVSFQQGENLKICHEIAPVYLTVDTAIDESVFKAKPICCDHSKLPT